MKKTLLSALFAMLTVITFAQTANVQIIHNSPSPGTDAGPVVDIYVNGALLPQLTAVPFRAATPYLEVPAGAEINVEVKVNPSTASDPAVHTQSLGNLAADTDYVVIANGIVGSISTPFTLLAGLGKQAATDPATVELNVFHGSPDAGPVDVDVIIEKDDIELLSEFSFGNFTGYVPLATKTHILNVYNDDVDIFYWADLSGLAGGAGVLFASGMAADSPGFGLYAALPDGTVVAIPVFDFDNTASVNVFHASPDAAVESVDLYLNNLFLQEISYLEASGFNELPAGDYGFKFGLAPAGSTSSDEVLAYFDAPILTAGESYMATASGLLSSTDNPVTLLYNAGVQSLSSAADVVALNVLHASPGAPNVDITARTVADLYTNVAYGDYTAYAEVPTANYYIDIKANGSDDIVATYAADVSTLGGSAATVVAAGLLGGDPGFGLYAVIDEAVISLPAAEVSRVQIIHNSPAPTVDIYANDGLLLAGLEFRAATPYLFLPANQAINIKVVPAGGPISDAVYDEDVTFGNNGDVLVVVASGVAGNDFSLEVNAGREAAESGAGVDLLVQHGSPDAPAVDVVANGSLTLIDDIEYKQFQGYANVPAAEYSLAVQLADNSATVATFDADLSTLDGGAGVVFASGYADGMTDPAFGLWVALADGTTFALPVISSVNELAAVEAMQIAPNPAQDFAQVMVDLKTTTALQVSIMNINGQIVSQLDLGELANGTQNITLNIADLANGFYQVILSNEDGRIARPLVVVK